MGVRLRRRDDTLVRSRINRAQFGSDYSRKKPEPLPKTRKNPQERPKQI